MRLYDLRTEYRINPIGLTAEAPRFSWKMESQEKDTLQTAYEINVTDENGEKAAYAQSVWVYMDVEKGRPVRPDQEELDAYGQCEPLEMDYESRKIALPEECMSLEPFPVRRYHIDTNEHVNNCQYVQMAMEMLDQERVIRQVRVEYKKSAVLGDMIVPRTGDRDGRTVVELCTTEGELYAAVEFAWV